jgi:hypothetical protein
MIDFQPTEFSTECCPVNGYHEWVHVAEVIDGFTKEFDVCLHCEWRTNLKLGRA